MWILTNIKGKSEILGNQNRSFNQFLFYCDNSQLNTDEKSNIEFYLDGYVIPRIAVYEEYKNYYQNDLLYALYSKFGLNFINKIKGCFNIILFEKGVIHVYNDQHSFNKFFFYKINGEIVLCSDIDGILKLKVLSIDRESLALYAIMEHFIDGYTLFEGLNYSTAGTHLRIDQVTGEMNIDRYFSPSSLLEYTNNFDFDEISNYWSLIINNYIGYFKPQGISLTLTGGNDSRMILSALLHNNINFHAFSFGNPESFDGVVANEIKKKIGFEYYNFFIGDPSVRWFEGYAEKIISQGNSLINIHRAHRLYAIEKEFEIYPENEMLFCGFMGGDYAKGLIYDDYITPRFFKRYEVKPKISEVGSIVIDEINRCKINIDSINLKKLQGLISELPMLSSDIRKIREFLVLFHLVGSIHDMQDTILFRSKIKYVINPFMDIDFMGVLFGSGFSFIRKENDFFWKILRLNRSKLQIQITHTLAPELSEILYAKKGHYNAVEYLNDRQAFLMIKRILRRRSDKKFPQNFPYNNWIKEYCHEELSNLNGIVAEVFNKHDLIEDINNLTETPSTEGFWHLFTNPINLSLNVKKFHNK